MCTLFYHRLFLFMHLLQTIFVDNLFIPSANAVAGVYSDPYVRPFVRSFVRSFFRLSVRPPNL